MRLSVCSGCKSHTACVIVKQALTHIIEMLPKGLHPPVCVLAAVCGQSVCDLLTSVLVANADVLNFTVRVFL